jgi:hypothetical protein
MEKETEALIAKTMEHEASDQVGVTHSLSSPPSPPRISSL